MIIDATAYFNLNANTNETTTQEQKLHLLYDIPYIHVSDTKGTTTIENPSFTKLYTYGYNLLADNSIESGDIDATTGMNKPATSSSLYRTVDMTPILPLTSFIVSGNMSALYVYYYDAEYHFIKRITASQMTTVTDGDQEYARQFVPPIQAKWAKFVILSAVYSAQELQSHFCVHLSWSGAKAGYKAPEYHEYDFSNLVPTEFYSAIDAYDTLTPDGYFTKRVISFKLSDLRWSTGTKTNVTDSSTGIVYTRFYTDTNDNIVRSLQRPSANTERANIMCDNLDTMPHQVTHYAEGIGLSTTVGRAVVYLKGSSLSVSTLLNNHGNDTIYAELAEPIVTKLSTSFTDKILVDDYGIQMWDDLGAPDYPQLPLSMQLVYTPNLKDFVQRLYDYTSGDPSNIQLM